MFCNCPWPLLFRTVSRETVVSHVSLFSREPTANAPVSANTLAIGSRLNRGTLTRSMIGGVAAGGRFT